MTATAPITQDVVTIPRKEAPEGTVNLVGLTRDGLKAALIEAGTPEKQASMRVNQIWQWIYHWGVRDFAAMTNLSKDYRAMLAKRFTVTVPEVVTPSGQRRRHAQVPCSDRWRARGRDRLHPGRRSRHALHFQSRWVVR